jgi:hypothetical protein
MRRPVHDRRRGEPSGFDVVDERRNVRERNVDDDLEHHRKSVRVASVLRQLLHLDRPSVVDVDIDVERRHPDLRVVHGFVVVRIDEVVVLHDHVAVDVDAHHRRRHHPSPRRRLGRIFSDRPW